MALGDDLRVLLGQRCLSLRYEEVLAEPLQWFGELFNFLELPLKAAEVRRLTGKINTDRRFAYRTDEELVTFARAVAERLALYGYEP